MNASSDGFVKKLPTGIRGFDLISDESLSKARTTLLAGAAGSAKTVFAVQFLAEAIMQNREGGVLITFEETPSDIRANMLSFGWDIERWEGAGLWTFVDASPQLVDESIVGGDYDLDALLVRLEHAVRQVQATRVSMDSLGAIISRFNSDQIIRGELFRISQGLRHLGVTALMPCERYGDEELVTDHVVVPRNSLEEEKWRRTNEILKFCDVPHQKGENPFTVVPHEGIVVGPISAITPGQPSSPSGPPRAIPN